MVQKQVKCYELNNTVDLRIAASLPTHACSSALRHPPVVDVDGLCPTPGRFT
jgi:hypothetical protein